MSDPCDNPKPGSQLASACSCQNSSKALDKALKDYDNQLEQYNTQSAAYTKYQNDLQDWQGRYDREKSSFSNQKQGGTCSAGWNCGNSNCPTGWTNDGSVSGAQGNCQICFGIICANTGCSVSCRPDDQNIANHMSDWVNSNPKPSVVSQPSQPSAPSGNNIQCCSQLFQNITANSANFDNIKQQCTQQIQNAINDASKPPPQPTPTPTVPTPTPTSTLTNSKNQANSTDSIVIMGQSVKKTTLYIIIGVIVVLLIVSSCLVSIVLLAGDNDNVGDLSNLRNNFQYFQ